MLSTNLSAAKFDAGTRTIVGDQREGFVFLPSSGDPREEFNLLILANCEFCRASARNTEIFDSNRIT